jgi:hypothetical protein
VKKIEGCGQKSLDEDKIMLYNILYSEVVIILVGGFTLMALGLVKAGSRAGHYRGIKSKITLIKKNWPGNEKIIQAIIETYSGMIVNVGQKIGEITHTEKDTDDIIETVKSFFIQLLWEYDISSAVNFTTYVEDHLFYRVKNFYERQNGTTAFLELKSPEKKRRPGSNDDPSDKETKIRYLKDSACHSFEYKSIPQNTNNDLGRSVASDIWQTMVRNFDEHDIDLIICSDLLKMKQQEIGQIFGVEQPHISDMRKDIFCRMKRFMEGALV